MESLTARVDEIHPDTFEVVVVGAGPSGLSSAIGLARAGVRVLVVDRHAGTSIFPKATGLRTRGLEILRGWGLEERLRAVEQSMHPRAAIGRTLTEPPDEHRDWLPADLVQHASPTTFSSVAQDQLEPVLLEHVRRLGVTVLFGTEAGEISDDGDRVTVVLRDLTNGREHRVAAGYLVAADGAHSPIRSRFGIDLTSYGSVGDQVAVLFYADLIGHIPGGLSLAHAITHPDAAGLLFPSGPYRWVYSIPRSAVDGPSPAGWTQQQWIDRLRVAVGVRDVTISIDRVFPWDFGAAAASALSVGRVFLVGDAAHRASPAGGTGISVGIADGHNLAWKLAWVLRGWADTSLLETYQAERGPIAHRVALRSMESDEIDAGQRLADDLAQSYRSPAISSPETHVHPAEPTIDRLDGRPGNRAPHVWVSRYGRRRSTLDLFEGRLTLLTGRHGTGWRAAGSAARVTGVPLRTLTVGRDVHPLDDSLLDRFGISPSGAVLIRPDGYVSWRSTGSAPDPVTDLALAVGVALGRCVQQRVHQRPRLLSVAC